MSAPAADTAGASWKLLCFDMLLWITQQHMKCHAGSTGSPPYRTEDLTTKSFLEITHEIFAALISENKLTCQKSAEES